MTAAHNTFYSLTLFFALTFLMHWSKRRHRGEQTVAR